MTALAIVWSAMKLRFEASGLVPHGKTVTYPPPTEGLSLSVTVTFIANAPIIGTPEAAPGRPARPSTGTSKTVPVPTALPIFAPPRC